MAYRKEKLEKQIMRIVSDLILKEIKDHRIGYVTVTQVGLNRDFSEARVGISVLGDAKEMRNSIDGINSAKGFIQFKLGKSLRIRHIPKLEFYPDSSVADGVKMVDLLEKLSADADSTDSDNENNTETDEKLEH